MPEQSILTQLSAYISAAGIRKLPEAVSEKARHHVLDTIAAMVSTGRRGRKTNVTTGGKNFSLQSLWLDFDIKLSIKGENDGNG